MLSWIAIDGWRRVQGELFPVYGFRVLAKDRAAAEMGADLVGEYSELCPVVMTDDQIDGLDEIFPDKSLLN